MHKTEFENCTGIAPELFTNPVYLYSQLPKYCDGWLGAESDFPESFGRYGYTDCGIRYGFYWKENPCAFVPEDFYKLVALSYMYWKDSYDHDTNELFTMRHMVEIRKYLDTLPPEERQPTFDKYPEDIKASYKKIYQRQNGEMIF